jgi:plasmid stabilization system protein ParE
MGLRIVLEVAMIAELIIAPEAQQDLEEAYSWYEERRPGLGEDFLGCVDVSIQIICRIPEIYSKVHEDYRRALIRRFPYVIFYEYTNKMVIVYSIFHTSQDPEKWRNRLV